MTGFTFLADIAALPEAHDPARAEIGLERWRAAGADANKAAFAAALVADPVGRALLGAIFGNSPFLSHCLLHDVGFVERLVEAGPDNCRDAVIAGFAAHPGDDRSAVTRRLRLARRRAALTVAIADIAGVWSTERITGALTAIAEAALDAALDHLLRAADAAGAMRLADAANPQAGCGITVIGLGKLGACELNYSSDIDLMVLYDPALIASGCDDVQPTVVRLTRDLLRLLQERTPDGYVFRTDMRLRPDPGATPLAVTVEAAETYYESLGQNWERAAMITARPVAGDRALGDAFVAMLSPFIWRKNLDFAAIQDIHSIKRQIHVHHGGGRIAVAGHNVKLGRGGIREIEFFAQTQQLIFGGRDASLRRRATCEALGALAAAGRIDDTVADEMTEAYRFLRRVEHRLQMIDDAQTHTLPATADGLEALAAFLGYPDAGTFGAALTERLIRVERHYADLFEDSAELAPAGNLVFTGTEDDPDTLATLEDLGYRDGRAVGAVVRAWHHGRFRATRSTRAREILTELMPVLLGAFARTADPDQALLRFNEFLSRLPAGVQLFSLFHANPALLDLVAEIMGSAPRLAERLSHNAGLLDGVLSRDFYDPLSDADALADDLSSLLRGARDYEDMLDLSRRWAHDREFQVGVQMLRGLVEGDRAGEMLADIADAVLRALTPNVENAFAAIHGHIPGGGMAIVGMGNLGGRQMTVSSDLDLTFVYTSADRDAVSDGAKSLPASQYYARLSQRLINALTALTAEGRLYEIDMRLRPSGQKGPVASEIASFERYHAESAWTWEHMVLTRVRVVTGPPKLAKRIEAAVRGALTRPRDTYRLVAEVADMRRRMESEHHSDNPWRTKYVRGGLVDLEFIAAYLQLAHASRHPEVLSPRTIEAFTRLAEAGILAGKDADVLIAATRLMRRVRGMLRLTIGGDRVETGAPEALRALLARSGEVDDFNALRDKLLAAQERVRVLYARLIDEPAAAAHTASGDQ
ncbi:MAG: bifunctional [glutamine synthetase] adenylyltransferase/[glutamine synthetase]-adenylyl-L-tyrosine phosphorylase [Alphaproteobacteria bacterium]